MTLKSLKLLQAPVDEPFSPYDFPFWAFIISIFLKIFIFPFYSGLLSPFRKKLDSSALIMYVSFFILAVHSIVKFILPYFPESSILFQKAVASICLFIIFFFGLFLLRMRTFDKILHYLTQIFYAQMILALFTFNLWSWKGVILKLLNYTAFFLLFALMTSILSNSAGGEKKDYTEGLIKLGLFVVIFNILSFPGSLGLHGDFLIILGLFEEGPFYAIGPVLGLIFLSIGIFLSFDSISPGVIYRKLLKEGARFQVNFDPPILSLSSLFVFILVAALLYLGLAPTNFLNNFETIIITELAKFN